MSAAATIQIPFIGSTTLRTQIFQYTQILLDTSACLPGITGIFNFSAGIAISVKGVGINVSPKSKSQWMSPKSKSQFE